MIDKNSILQIADCQHVVFGLEGLRRSGRGFFLETENLGDQKIFLCNWSSLPAHKKTWLVNNC
jgi:hypothetical protein